MKKIFKNPIFTFVLGLVMMASISYCVYALNATSIDYKNDKNVSQALDDLYGIANGPLINRLALTATTADSYGVRISSKTATLNNLSSGTYIVYGTTSHTLNSTTKQTSGTMNTSGLPTITTTSGSCTSLSQIRESSAATEAIATSVFINNYTYNQAWLCQFDTTASVSIAGHSTIGSSNKNVSSAAIIAIKLY